MANILDIKQGIAKRVRARRREAKLSQSALAQRSGVSLGSVKRFEGMSEISLASLLRIAAVLGYTADFDKQKKKKNYQSLDEVLNAK
jgi:transcriptional regulator with XRE-family HTH domain